MQASDSIWHPTNFNPHASAELTVCQCVAKLPFFNVYESERGLYENGQLMRM